MPFQHQKNITQHNIIDITYKKGYKNRPHCHKTAFPFFIFHIIYFLVRYTRIIGMNTKKKENCYIILFKKDHLKIFIHI